MDCRGDEMFCGLLFSMIYLTQQTKLPLETGRVENGIIVIQPNPQYHYSMIIIGPDPSFHDPMPGSRYADK